MRLSSVDGARRKRLIYFGMLAAATLAVTALIIGLSGRNRPPGAAGATGLDETENPWPSAEERYFTREEDSYLYAKTIATDRESATDDNPSSKRLATKARKAVEGRGSATTTTTTAATRPPDVVPDVSADGDSEKKEQPRAGPDDDRENDRENGSPPAAKASPSKRTPKPARPAHDGTKSTHKKKQATPGDDKSQTV
ncbi:hypothetical protein HPB51_006456 [Rhipicephalus microplus]|uniref:Uncharacterized protein n=1 Tax=Rhipicephalus microplus TaxID=6941 RepID=A0A9J6E7E5_RHIMP|nr:hypothetical protein HPB51_006456 [Rhipicephalus microplus]